MRTFSPIPYPRYPHMSPADSQLMTAFLIEHGKNYNHFRYDIPVGQGAPIPPGLTENLARDLKQLTQKKIDAIGFTDDGIEIFEAKPRAGLSALGQLLGYRALYLQDNPQADNVLLSLITSRLTDDELHVYQQHGITVYLYPELE